MSLGSSHTLLLAAVAHEPAPRRVDAVAVYTAEGRIVLRINSGREVFDFDLRPDVHEALVGGIAREASRALDKL